MNTTHFGFGKIVRLPVRSLHAVAGAARAVRHWIEGRLRYFIVEAFHRTYYYSGVWWGTTWLGTRSLKCPFDLWIYQEIIFSQKPDVIIETGTYEGGSALFLATICDLVKNGRVITIDVNPPPEIMHSRITFLTGNSVDPIIQGRIRELVGARAKVLVILDSDHHSDHVLEELNIFSDIVSVGSYMIVEDTNLSGHPIDLEPDPGPMEAVSAFLRHNSNFTSDLEREKFLLTFNPRGYLRRIE